jgi:hypothetical protein
MQNPNTILNFDDTATNICNLALARLGITKLIANLQCERSVEANVCRQFYAITITQVLEDYWWTFATKFATLPLVQRHPTREWRFAYGYPADCLKVRRILSHRRTDTRQSRVPFKVVSNPNDTSSNLIYTDWGIQCGEWFGSGPCPSPSPFQGPGPWFAAEIEYTFQNPNSSAYTVDFIMSAALRLAANIGPLITAGDPFQIVNKCMALYQSELAKAQDNSAQEEQVDREPEAEWIRDRMGTGRWGRGDGWGGWDGDW